MCGRGGPDYGKRLRRHSLAICSKGLWSKGGRDGWCGRDEWGVWGWRRLIGRPASLAYEIWWASGSCPSSRTPWVASTFSKLVAGPNTSCALPQLGQTKVDMFNTDPMIYRRSIHGGPFFCYCRSALALTNKGRGRLASRHRTAAAVPPSSPSSPAMLPSFPRSDSPALGSLSTYTRSRGFLTALMHFLLGVVL